MTLERAHWWTRAAQNLSRSGLLWLALTAVALGSLVSAGAGVAASARLVAASSAGSTSKLKANGPSVPMIVPGELSRAVPHRAQNPEAAVRRILAGGTPVGLLATHVIISPPAQANDTAPASVIGAPTFRPTPYEARGPPAIA
jgi:hypothetical protein